MGRKKKSTQQAEQQSIVNDGEATQEAVREVWLPIAASELAASANELATVGIQVNDLREEKTAKAKDFTAQIKKLVEQEKKLQQIVKSGTAPGQMNVLEHYDYAHNELIVTRSDTGEEVERRTLTAEEATAGHDTTGSEQAAALRDAMPGPPEDFDGPFESDEERAAWDDPLPPSDASMAPGPPAED